MTFAPAPIGGEALVLRTLDSLATRRAAMRVGILVSLATVGLLIDWLSGPLTSMLFAYTITVALGGYLFEHRWPALVAALATSAGSAVLHLTAGDSVKVHVVWINAALRFGSLCVVALAVSALRRHLSVLHQHTRVDSLTGVLSRSAILAELAAHTTGKEAGATTSVVFFDLDDLKSVNDGLGHAAGDELIRRFVSAVLSSVRPSDRLGRLGGDEFLLVCHRTSAADVRRMVERIVGTRATPSVSWGVASTEDGTGRNDLVNIADCRMYEAKRRSHTSRSS